MLSRGWKRPKRKGQEHDPFRLRQTLLPARLPHGTAGHHRGIANNKIGFLCAQWRVPVGYQMIPSALTEGMSTIEVLVVLLCAQASESEIKRLRAFLEEWEGRKA